MGSQLFAHRLDDRLLSTTKDRSLSDLFLGLKTEESKINEVDLTYQATFSFSKRFADDIRARAASLLVIGITFWPPLPFRGRPTTP